MTLFEIMAILVVLAAFFRYVNYRYFDLPATIGLMLMALVLSLGLEAAGLLGYRVQHTAEEFLGRIDFNETLLHGMLGFLLFAGALHVDLLELRQQRWVVLLLATGGVILSTAIVAVLFWLALSAFDIELPFIYCLLFGALISPTDPIAVLAILKGAGAPKGLEMSIAGESLFNDGIGVVLFLILFNMAQGGHSVEWLDVGRLFFTEVIGGALFGLVAGGFAYLMLARVDNYQVEVMITLALVMGGYALAEAWHVSAPIAMVVAGLLIGSYGRRYAMSESTCLHLDTFWELIDEILNAVLFVLIGFEVLIISYSSEQLIAGLIAIPIVLLARFISVGLPIGMLRSIQSFAPNTVKILTWGGLRGGISVAMALSLTAGTERDLIVPVTYVVVAFSIIVQGLTIKKLIARK